MTLGQLLSYYREERGFSLRELATLSGISHAYIHRLENGEKEYPSQKTLKALTKALKLDKCQADTLSNFALPIPDAWHVLLSAASAVINHWYEFGPEYGFDRDMDRLSQARAQLVSTDAARPPAPARGEGETR